MKKQILLSIIIAFLGFSTVIAQEAAYGNLAIDDFFRRRTLIVGNNGNPGWMLRFVSDSPESFFYQSDSVPQNNKLFDYKLLPLFLNNLKFFETLNFSACY